MSLLFETDHADSDQLKRQKSACSKKLTPISIDLSSKSGVFEGSNTEYLTSLDSCDCIDFARRKKPCKHMYRLAHELNLFSLDSIGKVESGILKKDSPYTVENIISVLPENEARTLKSILYSVVIQKSAPTFELSKDTEVTALLSMGIIMPIEPTVEYAANIHTIAQLKQLLETAEIPFKSSSAKKELVNLAISEIPIQLMDNITNVQKRIPYVLNPSLEAIQGSVYHQFTKMYPEPVYYFDPEE